LELLLVVVSSFRLKEPYTLDKYFTKDYRHLLTTGTALCQKEDND